MKTKTQFKRKEIFDGIYSNDYTQTLTDWDISSGYIESINNNTLFVVAHIYDIEVKAYGDYNGPKNQYVTDVGERKSIEIRKIEFDYFVKFFDIID